MDPVASYALTPSAATGGSFIAGNYNITYITGTLTVNAASNPVAQSITVSGGVVTVTFSGIAGVTYVTQAATDLAGAWTSISTNTPSGTTLTVSEPVGGGTRKFYRTVIP